MASQKTRTLRVVENAGQTAVVITEAQNGRIRRDAYFLSAIGSGFAFNKDDGTRYHVSADVCSCPGHKHYGHKTVCKHRAALAKLIKMGKVHIVEVAK